MVKMHLKKLSHNNGNKNTDFSVVVTVIKINLSIKLLFCYQENVDVIPPLLASQLSFLSTFVHKSP